MVLLSISKVVRIGGDNPCEVLIEGLAVSSERVRDAVRVHVTGRSVWLWGQCLRGRTVLERLVGPAREEASSRFNFVLLTLRRH